MTTFAPEFTLSHDGHVSGVDIGVENGPAVNALLSVGQSETSLAQAAASMQHP